jgi:hypothetical protein
MTGNRSSNVWSTQRITEVSFEYELGTGGKEGTGKELTATIYGNDSTIPAPRVPASADTARISNLTL